MMIRETTDMDLDTILDIHRRAFGQEEVDILTQNLLKDPSAEPRFSLLAVSEDTAVGHILFTAASLDGTARAVTTSLLAPLGVVPERHGQGIGQALIRDGLRRLTHAGVDLVFVLGHPGYYPRCGFEPAGRLGFDAPYPIPQENAGAWMVQALRDGVMGSVTGQVRCAEAVDRPEYWRE